MIPLTKIGFFNPGRLSDEEIEQSFIARVPLFEFIFKKIVSEKPTSIPQHHLLIGQRGMGKSSLLSRIAAELRKPSYINSFIPLSFPEEQYNVDRLSKFWLNCLDALADALDKENKKADLADLDIEISNLSKEKNLDANSVYITFEKWVNKIKRRPILLVDNLNLIFSKINKEEQHQLRAILMSKSAPILVGASATAIDETVDYQAPFYDAFQINYLNKLTFSESLDVLLNLARITGNEDFKNSVYLQKGRLEALYQLTGGTPRTLAILFPLIQNGFSENIQTDLDALLDIITPLYKARFEELPEQLQVVMDAVALNWDPINLEKLREVTMLENGQLSPQLKRLVDVGWLQKLDAYKAKGGAYELTERFFNVWYLMRRSSRRQKRELYCLTKFLESFYGNDLNEIAKARIRCKTENINHIALDLALADAVKTKKLGEQLRNKSYEALINMSLNDDGIKNHFTIPTHITRKKVNDLIKEADTLYKEKKYPEAKLVVQNLIKVDENDLYAWVLLGVLYNYHLDDPDEAEVAYKKAIEIDEKHSSGWIGLGNLSMFKLKNYTQAELAYKKIVELDETDASAWFGLGILYSYYLNKYPEAEIAYKTAIEIDGKDFSSWYNLGNLYVDHLNKYSEAEIAYKKAIEINGKDFSSWYNLGNLYADHLNKYSEAEIAYKTAIEIDNKSSFAWFNLANLYSDFLEKHKEAEIAYKKSIELDDKDSDVWINLANLYSNFLGKYKEAEVAYKKAIELDDKDSDAWFNLANLYSNFLGKHKEAEAAYKKTIELDDKDSDAWFNLALLHTSSFGKYKEAEKAYKKSIELNDKDSDAWYGLGVLYADFLGKYHEAEKAYKKSITLDQTNFLPWNGLGNIYKRFTGRYEEAEIAYKKAIKLNQTKASPWYNLGVLYADHLSKYEDAEIAYKKAIELDEKLIAPWNTLGNLYMDHFHKYNAAEDAYKKALRMDPTDEIAKYNLVFLWRDKMNKPKDAKSLFNTIIKSKESKDSYSLNEALFAYYDKNIGIAEKLLKQALYDVGDSFPLHTIDDWYRGTAVIIKLGYGNSLLSVLTQTDYDVILKPLYIAIEALIKQDELFLNSIATEIREPAKKIMEIMKNYMK